MGQSIQAVIGSWTEGHGPLHRRLSDALRRAIERGHLPAGERLPSERELAKRLAVSRSTVVAAYDTLRSEDLLESRQGSGTRIRAARVVGSDLATRVPPNAIYRSLIEPHSDVISLACAVFPAHPLVAEAIAAVASEEVPKLLAHPGYEPAGLPRLREGLADLMSRRGTATSPEQILVTTGAQQAISLAVLLLVRPGDHVIVESPSFAGTLDVFRTRGARLSAVPVDGGGVDARKVAEQARATRPGAIYLMPTFHNPTGVVLSRHRREVLAALASDEEIPILEDNALEHAPLVDDTPPAIGSFASPTAPVLTAGSFSKLGWGGLRIGWMRGPIALIARLTELKLMTDLGSPLFDQAVAARLVDHIDQLRGDHRALLHERLAFVRGLLSEMVPGWEFDDPQGGPSLWVRLPSGTAAGYASVALRYGVEIIPGDVMSPGGQHRSYLRLPFTAEPPVLEETVRRLALAWSAYAPADASAETYRTVVV